MNEEDAALIIQKNYRGYVSRKKFFVHTLRNGVIHARIRGDADLFAIIDVQIDQGRDSRVADVLSIDPNKYKSKAVGGKDFFLTPSPAITTTEPTHWVANNIMFSLMVAFLTHQVAMKALASRHLSDQQKPNKVYCSFLLQTNT